MGTYWGADGRLGLLAGAALWAIALFPVMAFLRALWRFGENRWRRVAVSTCAIAVMWFAVGAASVLARTSLDYEVPFPYVGAKLAVFVTVGGAWRFVRYSEWFSSTRGSWVFGCMSRAKRISRSHAR
jgi:hypothetical protein